MYEEGKILTETATKRLKVIKDFTSLGSGFAIATRDLSIRGAGDILGSEQAGFIDSVGIELFLNMIRNIRNERLNSGINGSKKVNAQVYLKNENDKKLFKLCED